MEPIRSVLLLLHLTFVSIHFVSYHARLIEKKQSPYNPNSLSVFFNQHAQTAITIITALIPGLQAAA